MSQPLAPDASCAISVDVKGTAAGVKNNSVTPTTTNAGTSNTANASLTVVGPPTITKAFGASSIPLSGSTSLSFTLTNVNTTTALSGVGFSDNLPAGLTVATPNGLTGSCGGGTITATGSTGTVSLTGATLAASASCTFSVNVTAVSAGTQNNTTGAVTSTQGGTGLTASASLAVLSPPSVAIAFGAATIPLNSTTSLSFTITNPLSNAVSLTGVAVANTLPTGLVVATPNGLAGTCGGGTITAVAGGSTIALSGASISANSSCTFSVNIRANTSGNYTNTTSTVTSANGGTGTTASAPLGVATPPVISTGFGSAVIPLNGSAALSFTIQNPVANSTSLSGIAFTDSLPAGLLVANPNGLSGSCGGGTITAVAGSGTVSLAGATIASGASCTFSLNVAGITAGTKSNSVTVSSTEGGTGNTYAASIIVAGPPTLTKSFGAASVPLNGTTTLSFTLTNPNSSVLLNGVGFADALPSGLVVATPNGLVGGCGGGTITAIPADTNIVLTGAVLSSIGPCMFSVNVMGIAAGTQNNTTAPVASIEGGTASASINVIAPPSLAIAFSSPNVALNGVSTLSFTITNPAANPAALTGVAFTDTLPAGLLVATPNALTGNCSGATINAAAGGSSITVSGVSVNTNSSCTIGVNIRGNASGSYTNTTGAVSSTNGGAGNAASASIGVATPPVISTAFGSATIPLNGSTTLSFTIQNPGVNTISLTSIGFTDTLPAGLVIATPNGLTGSCGGGTIIASAGTATVRLIGSTIASAASCTFSVNITGTPPG